MKIGIISPYDVLSMAEGASIRVFELAKGLNACGASVYVLHHGATKFLNSNFKLINFKSYNPLPNTGNYFHPLNPSYPSQLCDFIREYNPDIIQCEQPWSIFPTLFFARHFRIPCALDEHNVEFLWTLHASKVPFLAPFIFILEKIATYYSSFILTTSEVDKNLLKRIYNVPEEKMYLVPNGVDIDRLCLKSSTNSQIRKKLGFDISVKLVLFHGVMSAKQNYEAAKLILDTISPKITDATFLIVGKNPPKWLEMKAKLRQNVVVIGYVPSIEEYVSIADVCIAPIKKGSGTRLKILEYLAAGKPIVATCKAVEGLPIIDKFNALLFNEVNDDYINAIKKVLIDKSFAEKLGCNAKILAQRFDWKDIGNKLYKKYLSLLDQ